MSTAKKNYDATDSRLWLIDNSSSMKERDSHLVGGSVKRIEKTNSATRWQELQECVAFHAKMAARCWMPTKFWLANDPGREGLEQKFRLCWEGPGDIRAEMEALKRVMTGRRSRSRGGARWQTR